MNIIIHRRGHRISRDVRLETITYEDYWGRLISIQLFNGVEVRTTVHTSPCVERRENQLKHAIP